MRRMKAAVVGLVELEEVVAVECQVRTVGVCQCWSVLVINVGV